MTINLNIILAIILLFVVFDIVPDIDHYRANGTFSFKYKVVQLAKGWLGIEHDARVTARRGILHNFWLWFIIMLIGMLGVIHVLGDKLV